MGGDGRKPKVEATARTVAAAVVARVLRDDAYAAAALDAEIAAACLEPRDRALATELAYGTIRAHGVLADRLGRHVERGLHRVEPRVRAHLLVAAYQILCSTNVPAFAAVDEAVASVRALRGARVGGFANAVLRKIAASGEKLDAGAAAWESVPGWLQSRIVAAVGEEEGRALVGLGGSRVVSVRLRRSGPLPSWLEQADPGRASPLSRRLARGGDLRDRPGYAEGAFVVQEEGAQVVALAVGARPGERILDACAGRGQKATLIAERVGTAGSLWAADLHAAKLRALEDEFRRLGFGAPHIAATDWTVGPGEVPDGFDRVLVDAPCTGTGTLSHRPEISLRLRPDDPARLSALAERIVRAAATRAKPGGRVIVAVCSVLRDECEDLVARLGRTGAGPSLEPAQFDAPEIAHLVEPGASTLRLFPLRHGTDGHFVASFARK